MITSLPAPSHALVIGASGGIGAALAALLCDDPCIESVVATSYRGTVAAHQKIVPHTLDLSDEASIASLADQISPPNLVIIATGLLHDDEHKPEKSWRALKPDTMARAFAINSIGPALVAKHILPLMPRTGKCVFAVLSARVGSISDNKSGGWHSYRASKAALNQIIRTLSIEWTMKNHDSLCVALHPGTVATALSQPFQSNVQADKLFTPEKSARCLLGVIDELDGADTGGFFAWDGSKIPF
jgi:NAD(P)-dependent dehydrogenase (short-subunit alcohol dehydrogenase family)